MALRAVLLDRYPELAAISLTDYKCACSIPRRAPGQSRGCCSIAPTATTTGRPSACPKTSSRRAGRRLPCHHLWPAPRSFGVAPLVGTGHLRWRGPVRSRDEPRRIRRHLARQRRGPVQTVRLPGHRAMVVLSRGRAAGFVAQRIGGIGRNLDRRRCGIDHVARVGPCIRRPAPGLGTTDCAVQLWRVDLLAAEATASRWQMISVSLAGPGAGFLLGGLVALAALAAGLPRRRSPAPSLWPRFFGSTWVGGLVNLLPVLPLDGGHVVAELLPGSRDERRRRAAWVSVATGVVGAIVLLVFLDLQFGALVFGWAVLTNISTLRRPGQVAKARELDRRGHREPRGHRPSATTARSPRPKQLRRAWERAARRTSLSRLNTPRPLVTASVPEPCCQPSPARLRRRYTRWWPRSRPAGCKASTNSVNCSIVISMPATFAGLVSGCCVLAVLTATSITFTTSLRRNELPRWSMPRSAWRRGPTNRRWSPNSVPGGWRRKEPGDGGRGGRQQLAVAGLSAQGPKLSGVAAPDFVPRSSNDVEVLRIPALSCRWLAPRAPWRPRARAANRSRFGSAGPGSGLRPQAGQGLRRSRVVAGRGALERRSCRRRGGCPQTSLDLWSGAHQGRPRNRIHAVGLPRQIAS